jgi:hypothetical protein
MVLSLICSLPIFQLLSLCATDKPIGFGKDTTGGKGASWRSTYTVKNYNELKAALDNNGKPDAAKIIYVGEFEALFGSLISC